MPSKSPPKTSRALFAQRIPLILTLVGLCCLVFGAIIFIAGRILNTLVVGQIGASVLLIGAILVASRVFYWILEGIIGRGADELSKQADNL